MALLFAVLCFVLHCTVKLPVYFTSMLLETVRIQQCFINAQENIEIKDWQGPFREIHCNMQKNQCNTQPSSWVSSAFFVWCTFGIRLIDSYILINKNREINK